MLTSLKHGQQTWQLLQNPLRYITRSIRSVLFAHNVGRFRPPVCPVSTRDRRVASHVRHRVRVIGLVAFRVLCDSCFRPRHLASIAFSCAEVFYNCLDPVALLLTCDVYPQVGVCMFRSSIYMCVINLPTNYPVRTRNRLTTSSSQLLGLVVGIVQIEYFKLTCFVGPFALFSGVVCFVRIGLCSSRVRLDLLFFFWGGGDNGRICGILVQSRVCVPTRTSNPPRSDQHPPSSREVSTVFYFTTSSCVNG